MPTGALMISQDLNSVYPASDVICTYSFFCRRTLEQQVLERKFSHPGFARLIWSPPTRRLRVAGYLQRRMFNSSNARPTELFIQGLSRLPLCCLRAGFWRNALESLARKFQVLFQGGQGLRGETLDRCVFAVVCFVAEQGDIGFVVSHHISRVVAVEGGPGELREAGIGSLILRVQLSGNGKIALRGGGFQTVVRLGVIVHHALGEFLHGLIGSLVFGKFSEPDLGKPAFGGGLGETGIGHQGGRGFGFGCRFCAVALRTKLRLAPWAKMPN
jgi:hypothetical protein